MSDLLSYFSEPVVQAQIPSEFPSPFRNTPHQLTVLACEQLQLTLSQATKWSHDFHSPDGGKMFGVLLVKDARDRVGFLSAFSGKLAGQWLLPGFVPPVFSENRMQDFLPKGEMAIASLSADIESLIQSAENHQLKLMLIEACRQQELELNELKQRHSERKRGRQKRRKILLKENPVDTSKKMIVLSFESQQDKKERKAFNQTWIGKIAEINDLMANFDSKVDALKKTRTKYSRELHKKVFSHYQLLNSLGEKKPLSHFFENNKPPGGAGDCAAPKLLQFAIREKLTPLAMAEFWWGAHPRESVRHHRHYYPSCRGKCRPILPFMLKGLEVEIAPLYGANFPDAAAPAVLYETDNFLVVNKPAGLLSVPGKEVEDSVLTRIKQRYPTASGPLLVHRLDMDTSGVLLIAKNEMTHKFFQRQFIERVVKKRYLAILSRPIEIDKKGKKGVVTLPLRVDLDDRPRQLVCFSHGKSAKTHWEIIAQTPDDVRVYFYPHTGRTHQLRLHASHIDGLNSPIKGDKLYGEEANRLYLHAESLTFISPDNHQEINISAPVPF